LDKKNLLIFKVALPLPLSRLFDYLPPDSIEDASVKPGLRLLVPFSKGKKVGVLMHVSNSSEYDIQKLKRVDRILDETPLFGAMDLQLLQWAARYYHHPIGEVLAYAFPSLLRQGRPAVEQKETFYGLTKQGGLYDCATLHRAKRQQAALQLLQQRLSLSGAEFSQWNKNWRPALKELEKKRLAYKFIRQNDISDVKNNCLKQSALSANHQQKDAIECVASALGQTGVFLLQGVTGSGKTEVYLQLIHSVLERGEQVLVLLPEISLTPQLEKRFKSRFAVDIAVSHSRLTDRQRLDAWLRMQQGRCSILLGTRSALFVPLKRPGMIILDEEHDASFKQQEGFRFSARDVAIVRGKILQIPVILGSATPSLESLHNVARQRYRRLNLTERAGNARPPNLQLLDIRNKTLNEGLSESLVKLMGQVLAKQQQVLLFLNRRGFAPTLICHSCGWVARCKRCDANLVLHLQAGILRCHHCAWEKALIKQCQSCHASELKPLGLGTERVENVLRQLFPAHKIVRLDRDTTQRKGMLKRHLDAINDGQVDIILGTQMLAKGHHFPNVTLVAILDVDSGLFSIDYHAPERLAQLVMQVAGRAGRADKAGRVVLQTRHPDHPLLTTLIEHGYQVFAETALVEREQAQLPPFSYQAMFRVLAIDAELPLLFLQNVKSLIGEMLRTSILVMGPVSAPMAKKAGRYHYQLLLQSPSRQELHALLTELLPKLEKIKKAKKVRWSIDIDPIDLY
jgi:primosomal protein N' (replication factor Y)